MTGCRELLIRATPHDLQQLRSEMRASFWFYGVPALLFTFALAAAILFPPLLGQFHVATCVVLGFFASLFVAGFAWQIIPLWHDYRSPWTITYTGAITAKRIADSGAGYSIVIENRTFDVAQPVFDEVRLGDRLAVREWKKSGRFLGYTLDSEAISRLELLAQSPDAK